ncbi:hypothetical protein ACH4U5_17790 [Streptomyces sp. NPDC020858]|uniref:hypothetical protein n=1 Tax=Streptomyces sp. NPDC020858 TaxID=3365097 RepID=UPI0037A9868E
MTRGRDERGTGDAPAPVPGAAATAPVPGAVVPAASALGDAPPPGDAAIGDAAIGDAAGLRDALGDWRRDGLLLCMLPVLCWPAVVAAALTRPVMLLVVSLAVLLSPVALGVRELAAVRRVRRVLRDPAVRWTPYEAVVVRARWRPPVLVLEDGRHVLTLGVLGRRVLPPRAWPRTATPAPSVQVVRLAGDPAVGGILFAPHSRAMGYARPARGRRGAAR